MTHKQIFVCLLWLLKWNKILMCTLTPFRLKNGVTFCKIKVSRGHWLANFLFWVVKVNKTRSKLNGPYSIVLYGQSTNALAEQDYYLMKKTKGKIEEDHPSLKIVHTHAPHVLWDITNVINVFNGFLFGMPSGFQRSKRPPQNVTQV